ncbi:MAG: fused MFS/spermidine synthase [Actinomycetota bacterium]
MRLLTARLLVFGTSAAVLVLEILAGRLMAPYVGVSLETFTGIIGVILLGIAAGTAVGGRLADQFDPSTLLGPALIIGGVLSWWSLWIVHAIGPELGRGIPAIVVLASVAFVAPAAVLSAVSPMVAKLRLQSLEETGTVVGGLSAWGTAGALFGVFVTGFVLVAAMPTSPIVIGLGALLVVVGLAYAFAAEGRRPSMSLGLVVLVSFGVGVSAQSPCDFESAYFCGRVVVDPDDESVRFLVLDDLTHAAADLDDPTNLPIRYIRLLAAALDDRPAGPLDVVHIGGGGFSIPRYLDTVRPGGTDLVLEIDDELLDVARDELGFEPGPGTEVEVGDARLALVDESDDTADVVVGDAFGGAAVPWHLTTREFIEEIDRVLTPRGVYLMNVIDGGDNDFAEWMVATLAERFAHVEIIEPVDGVGARAVNQVLLASQQPIDRFDVGDDGRWVEDPDAMADRGRVLTDDFAPVDRLLSGVN